MRCRHKCTPPLSRRVQTHALSLYECPDTQPLSSRVHTRTHSAERVVQDRVLDGPASGELGSKGGSEGASSAHEGMPRLLGRRRKGGRGRRRGGRSWRGRWCVGGGVDTAEEGVIIQTGGQWISCQANGANVCRVLRAVIEVRREGFISP